MDENLSRLLAATLEHQLEPALEFDHLTFARSVRDAMAEGVREQDFPAELKQLKLLVDRKRETDAEDDVHIESPLTLILCTSVLVRAMKSPPSKIDRKVVAQLARKLGAHPPQAKAR